VLNGQPLTNATVSGVEGEAMNYTVTLACAPVAPAVVTVRPTPPSPNPRGLVVLPGRLRFTAGNWNVSQTVMVLVPDNAAVEPAPTGDAPATGDPTALTIRHAMAAGSATATNLTVTVNVYGA
jgi:hypothetical protein